VLPAHATFKKGGDRVMGCDDVALEAVMLEQARRHIKFSEDFRDQLYLDSERYPTFGWGHCFTSARQFTNLRDYADFLFESDFQRAYADYRRIIERFGLQHLSCPRRMVILDMCYNMNYDKVAKFVNSLDMLRTSQWERAVENLKQSLWYRQVGRRADRLMNVILSDHYPVIPNQTASGALIY
jgi:lysozyme